MATRKSPKSRTQLAVAMLLVGCAACAHAGPGKGLSYTMPSTCHFSANSSGAKYLSVKSADALDCGFDIDQGSIKKYSFKSAATTVFIYANASSKDFASYGFANIDGKWKFAGHPDVLANQTRLNWSLSENKSHGVTTLIGTETVYDQGHGNKQLMVHYIDVLKLTKTFTVATEFRFAPSIPIPVRNTVEADLATIVDSVAPAPKASATAAAAK